MNPVIKLIFSVGLLFIFLPFNSMAQDNTSQTNRSFRLSGSSKSQRIILNVDPATTQLNLNVRSRVRQGSLKIEIYDPNNVKRENFSIEGQQTSNTTSSEMVEGRISKIIDDPKSGEWLIKIIPTTSHGDIQINTRQVSKQ